MLHRLFHYLLLALLVAACRDGEPASQEICEPGAAVSLATLDPGDEAVGAGGAGPIAAPVPLVRCVEKDGPLVRRSLEELEDLALEAETRGDALRMLACADEALRLAEDDAAAAHLRAEALLHQGRIAEAAPAFTLALALAPHDAWVLAGAAELYANSLPLRRDHTLIALAYAERGLAYAPQAATDLQVQLHLLAGWAQADLGHHREALVHAGVALQLQPGNRDAQVVRGRALYELTRFPEAVQVLEAAVTARTGDAEAHHLLGLALERIDGRLEEAERHLGLATALEPVGFPAPVAVDAEGLAALVSAAVAALPERERGLLSRTQVPVQVVLLPDVADLRAVEPPLSPTAVGMFRGPPLGVTADEPREILLFARNLRRTARSIGELREQVRITLLHELGHLAGEDEAALRARGLE